jgi:hypothetical protein
MPNLFPLTGHFGKQLSSSGPQSRKVLKQSYILDLFSYLLLSIEKIMNWGIHNCIFWNNLNKNNIWK